MTAPTIVARGDRPATDQPVERGPAQRRTLILGAALGVALLAAALVLTLTRPSASTTPFAPNNTEPQGARAAAQILREHGVEVTYVRTTAAAIAAAEAGTTLLIVGDEFLRDEQLTALRGVEADIVLSEFRSSGIAGLTDRINVNNTLGRATRTAGCSDADAQAAATIAAGGTTVTGEDVTLCFIGQGGALYATWTEGAQRWRYLADGHMLSNDGLDSNGNAALVFRSLGAHDRLIWYIPSPDDRFSLDEPASQFPLPREAVWFLLLVGLTFVVWRARRLGPVVVEPLPVVVRAAETTRGRGRLYRRARAHAHAGAALRAGFVARVAGRLGLPTHAPRDHVIDTLARASGRDADAIHDVLYGHAPSDADSLVALSHALDTLESEVLHP